MESQQRRSTFILPKGSVAACIIIPEVAIASMWHVETSIGGEPMDVTPDMTLQGMVDLLSQQPEKTSPQHQSGIRAFLRMDAENRTDTILTARWIDDGFDKSTAEVIME